LCDEYGVKAYPTLVWIEDGKVCAVPFLQFFCLVSSLFFYDHYTPSALYHPSPSQKWTRLLFT